MGGGISLIDSATETASEIKETLVRNGIEGTPSGEPLAKFYVTDAPERFLKVVRFLGQKIAHIEQVSVGQ